MTDRFSHPLSVGSDSLRRTSNPRSRAVSPRCTPRPVSVVALADDDRRNDETGRKNRSRASTRSTVFRPRIPPALAGIGQQELEIYLERWEALDDKQVAQTCVKVLGTPASDPHRSILQDAESSSAVSRAQHDVGLESKAPIPSTTAAPWTGDSLSKRDDINHIMELTLPKDASPVPLTTPEDKTDSLFPPSPSRVRSPRLFADSPLSRSSTPTQSAPVNQIELQEQLMACSKVIKALARLARELGENNINLEDEIEGMRRRLALDSKTQLVVEDQLSGAASRRASEGDTLTRWSTGKRSPIKPTTGSRRDLDQISIHDSLNEAIGTSLGNPSAILETEWPSPTLSIQPRSVASGDLYQSHRRDSDADRPTLRARTASGSVILGQNLGVDATLKPRKTDPRRGGGSPSHRRDSGGFTGKTRADVANEHGVTTAIIRSGVPPPKKAANRSSWTANLWGWSSKSGGSSNAKDGRRKTSLGRTDSGKDRKPSQNAASLLENRKSVTGSETLSAVDTKFQPANPQPVVSSHKVIATGDGSVATEERADLMSEGAHPRHDQDTPSFRAIFLATRLLGRDSTSILTQWSRGRIDGDKTKTLAYNLVRTAREEDIQLKATRDPTKTAKTSPPRVREGRETDAISLGDTVTSNQSKRKSIANILPGPPMSVFGAGNGTPQTSGTAKDRLLKSISHRDATEPQSGLQSLKPVQDKEWPSVTKPLSSPGLDDLTSAPTVELNAITAAKNKPPTLTSHRTTSGGENKQSEPVKMASRFGESEAELAPYTDKYGFVYDLRYVRLLLDLKAASGDSMDASPSPTSDPDWFAPVSRGVMSSKLDGGREFRPQSQLLGQSPADSGMSSPRLTSSGLTSPAPEDPKTHVRPRSSTVAAFSPSPAKIMSSQQAVTISSRGAFDLRPTVTSGLQDPKGSVRLQKAKLDSLASRQQKPVSALLSQLSEVHDSRELETQRKWESFLKYRHAKASKKAGDARVRSSMAGSGGDKESWPAVDMVGIANMGDGKTGQELMKRFKNLVVKFGVPINLRASIWAECSGAKDAFIPGEYHEILAVHQQDEHPVLGEIDKDVKRTFPTNIFFGGDGVGCEKLRRLLTAYAWHDPSIGYCQGMNMVAAMLLLIYEDEELAYWTFVSLIQNLLPKDWFTPSLQGSMTEQAVLADLVLEFLPKTDAHFAELGLELSAVTFGWMLSLFTSCLPIETVLRIWDCFMVEGQDVIILTALAILKIGESGILQCDNVEDLFDYLNSITERLWSPEKLVKLQDELRFTFSPQDLAARRQRLADDTINSTL